MIFCLIGKSSAGKDTILAEILKKGLLENIVSSTTRPMRSNEIPDISYHFISKEEFLEKMNRGDFLETTEYHVATNDTWYYGIDRNHVDKDKNYITIVNPSGYRQIKAKLGDKNVIGILVTSEDRERLIRSLTRDINVNVDEVIRRYYADSHDFQDIEKEVKYIIKNRNLQQSVRTLEKIIENETGMIVKLPPIRLGSLVRITKILNTEEAGHLVKLIGTSGYVVGKITYKGIDRYKVLIDLYSNETVYLRRAELEVIE